MSIRVWREDDLDSVVMLLQELLDWLKEEFELSRECVLNHFRHMKELPEIYQSYVYEKDNKIVGFISLVFYRNLLSVNGSALVHELVVKEEYRNQSIGKQLLDFAVEEAERRGMNEIELGVEKKNVEAIRFYKRNGMDEEYFLLGKEFNC
jgi:ribosomal protein S18 acetylase RimI-like enzyme